MKINISDIVKTDGASLDINFSEVINELNTVIGEEFIFNGPVEFTGKLVNTSGVLKLEGHVQAEFATKCYRCLKNVDGKVDADINESFVDKDKVDEDTDVEMYTYESNFIEVDKILIDNIVLNLPMKQICEVECKGICPKCGTDLNIGTCECKDEDINPKMEVLKNFFKS